MEEFDYAAMEVGFTDDDEDGADGGEESVLLNMVQSYDWPGTMARIASHPEGRLLTIFCVMIHAGTL